MFFSGKIVKFQALFLHLWHTIIRVKLRSRFSFAFNTLLVIVCIEQHKFLHWWFNYCLQNATSSWMSNILNLIFFSFHSVTILPFPVLLQICAWLHLFYPFILISLHFRTFYCYFFPQNLLFSATAHSNIHSHLAHSLCFLLIYFIV